MEYSRWTDSKWFAFYNESFLNPSKEDQIISLWYKDQSAESTEAFAYNKVKFFKKLNIRSLYPRANDDEAKEAIDIIKLFVDDIDRQFAEDDMK